VLALEKSAQRPNVNPGLMGDGGERTTAGMDCSPQVPAKGVCGRSGVQPLVLEGQRVELTLNGIAVLANLEQQLRRSF
jgi:hypothetical protein